MIYTFRILTGAISIYSILCVIRIVLTWIPSAIYSPFGRFLCALCDPFLNAFRFNWLRFGAFDLSPLFALALLSGAAFLCQVLGRGARITFALILAATIQIVWMIVSSILVFIILFLAIRLIVFLLGADRQSSVWQQVDATLNPFVYSITKFFSGGRPVAYKNALILALVILILARVFVGLLVGVLVSFVAAIPF